MKILKQRFVSKIFLIMAGVAFLLCLPAIGQVVRGSISGTVTDSQGALIAGAQVRAIAKETGAAFGTISDGSGLFRISLIPAGNYKVELSAQGFKKAVQENVQVTAGADTGLGTLNLAVGETAETVEVTATAPLVESSQAQVTNTFSGVTLQTFPGIQENQGLDNLALFVPGVSSSRDNNFANANGGQGFSVNGVRGRNNDQEIDGQNNNDNEVTGPALFVSDPNFVQQYVVITNNFGPEYGRNGGSVVNIITASGSNTLHGSIYGTENNSILNGEPEDEKAAGLSGPPRGNDEFGGGTIGMPWIKNKLFFFGGFSQQIVSDSFDYISSGLTPTPAGLAALAGCFSSGASGNAVANLTKFGPYGISGGNPTPVASPLTSTNIVNPFTGALACPGVQESQVSRLLPTPSHFYNFVIRQDWQAGANDLISGRYLYDRTLFENTTDGTSAAVGYPENIPGLSQATLISWTHNFGPRMVNEARIGYDRLNVQFGGNTIGSTVPTPGNITSAFPSIAFLDGITQGLGPAGNEISSRFVNTWQGQDNWNLLLGKHQLKAGVNYTHQQTPSTFLPGIDGIYSFANLSAYIANQPNSALITVGNPEVGYKEDDTFLYIGDDWKIKPNLTLNLGLTWSYFSQPSNALNQLTTANETGPNPLFNPALPLSIRTFPSLSPYLYAFGPSFGFAYSPQWGGPFTGHGKTVIRGGYRVSYDPGNLNIYLNNYDSAPSTLAAALLGANFGVGTPAPANLQIPLNPTGASVSALLGQSVPIGQLDPRTLPEALLPTDYRPDQVQQWSLGIEREVSKNSVFEARYVGNHASQLLMNVNANPLIAPLAAAFPNVIPAGVTPCSDASAPGFGRVNCNLGVEQLRTNDGFSNYNGLQVNFRANSLFRQLTMTASYTYSKTLDNTSEIFSTGSAGNTIATAQNPFNIKGGGEYSISGLNFPNVFSIQLTEQLPFFGEQHGFLGHLLGGWAGSLDYIYSSGQPYTPDMASLADSTDFAAGLGDIYDSAFEAAFIGAGYARPFLGNTSAPVNTVGIFCGDVLGSAGCANAGFATNQLLSLNALNGPNGGSVVGVTNQQVRFIANTATAQQIFGTPYGNVPRNYLTDGPTNTGNISIFKNFKLRERVSFEFHVTMLNAFNHENFAGVQPFIEAAGAGVDPFAVPSRDLDGFNGLTNEIPGQTLAATRRVFFGGKLTF